MPTIGDEIGLRELQARWAYSELVSPRFIAACVGFADFPELFDKARKGFAFENLTKEEVRVLVGYERHRAHGSGRPCGFVEKTQVIHLRELEQAADWSGNNHCR